MIVKFRTQFICTCIGIISEWERPKRVFGKILSQLTQTCILKTWSASVLNVGIPRDAVHSEVFKSRIVFCVIIATCIIKYGSTYLIVGIGKKSYEIVCENFSL